MTDYIEFFLNTKSDVIEYDTIEIAHPSFSKTYYVVRNAVNGLTVTLEDSSEQEFIYYPMKIITSALKDDLDYGIRVDFGDLGEVIPIEFDSVFTADTFDTKPTVKYRSYRSDDLTGPMWGPVTLEVAAFNFDHQGASFEARAPQLNRNRTGELYTIDRFPMLRGFI